MSEITDAIDDWEQAKDHKFLGKRIGDMERDELLCVIKWLTEAEQKARKQRFDAEQSKAGLMREMASH